MIRVELCNDTVEGLKHDLLTLLGNCSAPCEAKTVVCEVKPVVTELVASSGTVQPLAETVKPEPKKRGRPAKVDPVAAVEPAKEETTVEADKVAKTEVVEPAKGETSPKKVTVGMLREACLLAAERLGGETGPIYAVLEKYDAKNAAQVPETDLAECYSLVTKLSKAAETDDDTF